MAESTISSPVDTQHHMKIEEPTSFYYETVVKEELIIEDLLQPVEDDDGLDEIDYSQIELKVETFSESNPESSKGKYFCEKCNKSFPNPSAFNGHECGHKVLENGKYTCRKCEKHFVSSSVLHRHETKHCKGKAPEKPVPKDGKYSVCQECNKIFSNRASFYQHKYGHKNARLGKFKCKTCDKIFMNGPSLKKHVQTVHEGNKKVIYLEKDENNFFKCPECDKRFEHRYKCNKHLRQHFALNQELYKCKYCEIPFKTSTDLRNHEQAHEYRQPRIANEPNALICHEATAKEENGIHTCSVCLRTFHQRKLALEHLIKNGYYKRERVSVSHGSALDGNGHKHEEKHQAGTVDATQTQLQDPPFECQECGKKFTRRFSLIKHIQRHQAVKSSPFKCKFCYKFFKSRVVLNKHEARHSSLKEQDI